MTKKNPIARLVYDSNAVLSTSDEAEQEQHLEKRKNVRVVLPGFFGAYVSNDKGKLIPVSLYDISNEGLAFDIDSKEGTFHEGHSLAFRIYFTQDNYIQISAIITNGRQKKNDSKHRYGASLSHSAHSRLVIYHLVRFLKVLVAVIETEKQENNQDNQDQAA